MSAWQLAAGGEAAKAGPLGFAVILGLAIACYFLFRSMSRHLKKVRDNFPGDVRMSPSKQPDRPETEPPNTAPPQTSTPVPPVPPAPTAPPLSSPPAATSPESTPPNGSTRSSAPNPSPRMTDPEDL